MGNNKLEIFKNEKFGEVRTIVIDNEPWFVAADVCKVFGISNGRNITARLDDDEKGVCVVDTLGGKQNVTTVSEAGLYHMLFTMEPKNARGITDEEMQCRLDKLKQFKRWVTHDVIPSIRKHGAYMTENTLESCINNPDFAIGLLTALKEEREKSNVLKAKVTEQNKQIEEMKPKASYYDIILNCKDSMPITNISKDYGMSAKAMNAKLHELGVQYKQSGMWLLYQKYANMGYTQSKTFAIDTDNSHMHTYWTQKGRVFLYNLLKENDIIPTMERGDEN